jgi:hypothetical protein
MQILPVKMALIKRLLESFLKSRELFRENGLFPEITSSAAEIWQYMRHFQQGIAKDTEIAPIAADQFIKPALQSLRDNLEDDPVHP